MPGSTLNAPIAVVERVRKLGLDCASLPLDNWSSALAALCAFPLYMVANVHGWTADHELRVPILDMPGSEALLEALAIGREEGRHPIEPSHSTVLRQLLGPARAVDRVVYEYALDTIAGILAIASPTMECEIKLAIARGVVAVANASGKGLLGLGRPVSDAERDCIRSITVSLSLASEPSALAALELLKS